MNVTNKSQITVAALKNNDEIVFDIYDIQGVCYRSSCAKRREIDGKIVYIIDACENFQGKSEFTSKKFPTLAAMKSSIECCHIYKGLNGETG